MGRLSRKANAENGLPRERSMRHDSKLVATEPALEVAPDAGRRRGGGRGGGGYPSSDAALNLEHHLLKQKCSR